MREKLIELLTDNLPRIGNLPKCDNPLQYTSDEIVERIADHLIANGVTIPVRCKDCKHFVPFVDPYNKAGMCNRKMLGLIPEDGFCSYGERSADAETD